MNKAQNKNFGLQFFGGVFCCCKYRGLFLFIYLSSSSTGIFGGNLEYFDENSTLFYVSPNIAMPKKLKLNFNFMF